MSLNPFQGDAAGCAIHYLQHLPPESSIAEKPKRTVSFRPTVTVHPVEKLSSNQDYRSRLYLSRKDMSEITINNKAILSSSKKTRGCDALYNCAEHGISGLQADPALRGLELSLCPTRVRNVLITTRTIIKYHRKLNADPTKSVEEKLLSLAAVSSKMSQWSTLIALETARHDSLQVYRENDSILINKSEDISLPPITKRRRIACNE